MSDSPRVQTGTRPGWVPTMIRSTPDHAGNTHEVAGHVMGLVPVYEGDSPTPRELSAIEATDRQAQADQYQAERREREARNRGH